MLVKRDDGRSRLPWWEWGNLSAWEPPPGQTSNFVDPPSLVKWDTLTITICLTLATLLISIKFYTKCRILRKTTRDDYLVLLAWLGLVGLCVICIDEDQHGNGRHLWDITGYEFVAYAKLNYILSICYSFTMFFTKAAILLLYLQAFRPVRRALVILHTILWANFAFYASAVFVEAFQCTPIEKAWLPLMDGHCFNQDVGRTASAAINCISDFVILILPIASIWNLQVYRKAWIGMIVIFGFGLSACIFSFARLILFARPQPLVEGVQDGTWIYYPISLISIAEVTCGIICGCLPATPAFLRHISGLKIKILNNANSHPSSNMTLMPQRENPRVTYTVDKLGLSTASPIGTVSKPTLIYNPHSKFVNKCG